MILINYECAVDKKEDCRLSPYNNTQACTSLHLVTQVKYACSQRIMGRVKHPPFRVYIGSTTINKNLVFLPPLLFQDLHKIF